MFQRIPKLNILPQPKNDQEEKTQKSTLHITSQIVPDELATGLPNSPPGGAGGSLRRTR